MAQLLLRGECLGTLMGGCCSIRTHPFHSEPRLIEQGHSRIAAACDCWISSKEESATSEQVEQLKKMMQHAYGLSQESVSLDGLLAVASRQHNLVATATVFTLLGLSGPVLC